MKLRGPIKDTKTFATAFLLYVILLQKLVDKILRNKIHQSEVKKKINKFLISNKFQILNCKHEVTAQGQILCYAINKPCIIKVIFLKIGPEAK